MNPYPLPTDHSETVKPDTTSDLPHIFLKNALSDLPKLHNRMRANSSGLNSSPSDDSVEREASKKAESNRRTQLLRTLSREFILSHDNLSPGLLAGTEWPPIDWINNRLNELGESWSVLPGKNSMELLYSERNPALDTDDHSNPILQWGTSEPGTNSAYVIVNTRILKRYHDGYRILVIYRAQDGFTEARDDTRIAKSELFEITGERKVISTKLGQDFMRQLAASRSVQIYLLLLPNHVMSDSVVSVNDAVGRGAVLVGTRAMQVSAVLN